MKRLTVFRDTLKDIIDQTGEESRDRSSIKQKYIVSSFVPQHEESSVNVRVSSGIRNKEKKDDKIMRNSIGMLNGLQLVDIRSNITNHSDLLDDIGEGVEIAQDYMVNQLMMNKEMHSGLKDLLNVTIDKIKKKRDGVDEPKNPL
ncbi:hypothetical protein E3N88_10250 [Mikania micrantha]|uniref:Uncharacterized protein n=1 Tax=Mikania micrantha TaxID=192012 RepID=A0A5N6PB88_9ASTR|nr:hypothetical protein E3N88_10250 [Mikania micrantha]